METETIQHRRRLPRCGVCRLPADTLGELHRERRAWGVTFDHLAEKLRASGHATSPSALRRHFRTHVRDDAEDGSAAAEPERLDAIPTPFDPLVGQTVDDRAVADVVVNVLVEQLRHVEQARRATHDGPQADRCLSRSLQQMAALDRALRRRQEIQQPYVALRVKLKETLDRALRRRQDIRKPYVELRAKLKETLDRIAPAAGEACRTVMQEHLATVDQAVDEFLRDYRYPDRLVRRLAAAKTEFPKLFASRVTEALKTITQETRDALR